MDYNHLGQRLLLGFHKALFLFFLIFISACVIFVSVRPDCDSPDTPALYVDDCKTLRIIDNALDHALLQRDIDNQCYWSQLNNRWTLTSRSVSS